MKIVVMLMISPVVMRAHTKVGAQAALSPLVGRSLTARRYKGRDGLARSSSSSIVSEWLGTKRGNASVKETCEWPKGS